MLKTAYISSHIPDMANNSSRSPPDAGLSPPLLEDGLPDPDFDYGFTLTEIVQGLGLLVGPGLVAVSDRPTTALPSYQDLSITATENLKNAAHVATVAELQALLQPANRQTRSLPLHAQVVPPPNAHRSPSRPRVAPTALTPLHRRASSAELPAREWASIPSSSSAGEANSYRPRADTDPGASSGQLASRVPSSQALTRTDSTSPAAIVPPQPAVIPRAPGAMQARSPLDQLSRHVEAAVQYSHPHLSGFSFSGNFTPGGFGLRVRSQSRSVSHNTQNGNTLGFHSTEILQQDTRGNAHIANDRSDMQGSWSQVNEALKSLDTNQPSSKW